MYINKAKNGVVIITITLKELTALGGRINKDVTVRKLKSKKDTYRIWVRKNFTGVVFV